MAEQIYYLEQSDFLSKTFLSFHPDHEWMCFSEEDDFVKEFFLHPPALVVIGDTGSENPLELIYSMKSVEHFGSIPILFCGEHDQVHILPVDACLSREEDDIKANHRKLHDAFKQSRILFQKNTVFKAPEGFTSKNFRSNRSRALMREEVFQRSIKASLESLDITDQSFEAVLEIAGRELCRLLSVDFVFIRSYSEKFNRSHFHSRRILPEQITEQVLNACLKKSSGKANSQPPQSGTSFGKGVEGSQKSEGIRLIRILATQDLSADNTLLGYLILGALEEDSVHLPLRTVRVCADALTALLGKGMHLYGKIEENKTIYNAFTQFLPAAIIDDLLLKESEKALLTGEKRKIVVLFSHIRQFEHIAEHNDPAQVVGFLNAHFTNMVRIIQSHGGSIDKFIGDAVFAIFGAPISYLDNTRRAAEASMEMIRRYQDVSLEGLNLPDCGFTIGVGLNEGEAIIGNIGCADKFDYTAIGDTVNLAARLESLTKHYNEDILVSKVVWEEIRKEYFCRLVDRAKVKGKSEATEIYSLIENQDLYTEQWQNLYNRGLKMYTLGSWYSAAEYLEKALEILPEDQVSQILLERCLDFQVNPPDDWDGSIVLNFK